MPVTVAEGFINDVVKRGDHTFLNISLITKVEKGGQYRFQKCSLLASRKTIDLLSLLSNHGWSKDETKRKRLKFAITGLHFYINDAGYISNEGVLDIFEDAANE